MWERDLTNRILYVPSAKTAQASTSNTATPCPNPETAASPKPSTAADGAPNSVMDELKHYVYEMVSQLQAQIQVIDKRLYAVETTKKKKHKKPKHGSLLQIPDARAQSAMNDGDSSFLST